MPQPQSFNRRLAGKVAIVTGAGSVGDEIGIGRAIAMVLGGEGGRVGCLDIDEERAKGTAAQLEALGAGAFSMAVDVTDPNQCEAAVAATVARFGRLDILINNVGISTPLKLDTADEAQWRRVLDTNLTSALWMSKFAVLAMKANGGGAIVNISSIAGIRAHGALAYGPSKAAMAQLAREIAVMHGRDGIRANTVAPGHVMTPHVAGLMSAELREARRKIGPLGIEGDAWDVAQAVLFLASDEARFITGQEVAVDGGVTAIGPMTAHALIGD